MNPAATEFAANGVDDDCDGAAFGSSAVRYTGEAEYTYGGRSVSGAGDVNGDGYDDVITSAYGIGDPERWVGRAYVLLGGLNLESGELGGADVMYDGEGEWDAAGVTVAGSGDVNADGYATARGRGSPSLAPGTWMPTGETTS